MKINIRTDHILLAIGKAHLPPRVAALQHEKHAVKRVDFAANRIMKLSFTLLRLFADKALWVVD